MSSVAVALTSAWTAITSAGEGGTCWLQKAPGQGQVVINHGSSGSGSLTVDDSYFMPDDKNVITDITPDDVTDIFYARCTVTGETANIVVDVF